MIIYNIQNSIFWFSSRVSSDLNKKLNEGKILDLVNVVKEKDYKLNLFEERLLILENEKSNKEISK